MFRPIRFVASRKAVILSSAISAVAFVSQAHAQTWLNPVSGNWSVPTNWFGAVAPVSANTTTLTFGGTGYTATNNIGSFSLNKLISNVTGPTTIDGNTLSFGGTAPAITQNGAGAIQISNAVELTASTAIGGTGTGTVTLAGALSSNPVPDFVNGFGITLGNTASRLAMSGTGSAKSLMVNRGSAFFTGGNYTFTSNGFTTADTARPAGAASGDTGTISITSGEVNAGNVLLAGASGAAGILRVSGASAKLSTNPADPNSTGDLFSLTGTASITVNNGGQIQTSLVDLGFGGGSSNTLITNANSKLRTSQALIGLGGAAASTQTLTVSDNAVLECFADVAFGTSGTMALAYGDNVTASLAIQSGGKVNSDGNFFLSYPDTDTGAALTSATLSINGPGSQLNLTDGGALVTGSGIGVGSLGGSTTISISNQGVLNAEQLVGGNGAGTQAIVVTGTGSQLNINAVTGTGYFDLGYKLGANQSVRYEAGATGTNNSFIDIGAVGGSNGTLTVTGAGSSFTQAVTGDLNNANFFDVAGGYSTGAGSLVNGAVQVLNGGSMTADWFEIAAFGQTNASGTLTVDGTNSQFTSSLAFLGTNSAGVKAVATISGGGFADFGQQLSIAADNGPAGTVVGSATVNIQSGGLVNVQFLDMANNVGTAMLNIDGTDSQMILPGGASSQALIADDNGAHASVNITNGGALAILDVTSTPVLAGAIFVATSPGATGTINLSGTDSFLGAGFLGLAGDGTLAVSAGNGVVNQSGGDAVFGLIRVYNNGTYNLSGGGYSTLSTTVEGRLNYSGGAADVGTLSVAGQVIFTAGNNKTLKAGFVSTSGTGKIDLADNAMVVDNSITTSTAQLTSIRTQIKTGRASGGWNGNGITSSTAASAPNIKGIGAIRASDVGTTSFRGVAVTTTGVLVRTTYLGDTDLDGDVDSTDFTRLAGKYGQTAGSNWIDGDFNYDDKVSTLDFNYLAGNFGAAVLPSPVPGPVLVESGTMYSVGTDREYQMDRLGGQMMTRAHEHQGFIKGSDPLDKQAPSAGLGSVVPEPTSFALLGVAGLGMAARRRRV